MDIEEIAHYFRDWGFTNINRVANNGIDIVALSADEKRISISCKNGKVHKNDVQKFYFVLIEGNIIKKFIVLNGKVTEKAAKFVKENPDVQIDLLYYSELQTRPVQKPHWQYRLARDFVALTIIATYCFLFTIVTLGVMEEAKHTYHDWSVIYFLNGIFEGYF